MKEKHIWKGRNLLSVKLQGSYTVEAAWILAISFMVIGACIITGYDVFRDSIATVNEKEKDVDVVALFREGAMISEIFENIK